MSGLFEMLQHLMTCGALVVVAFLITLALPQSKLRAVLMPIVGWAMAIFCAFYAISPIDIIPEAMLGPFGLVDDIGAVVAGISAARMAMSPQEE